MFVFVRLLSRARPSRVAAVALVIVLASVGGVLQRAIAAPTTGEISGTVTDVRTHAPIANTGVAAVAPTGRYAAMTDAKGFFSMTGVTIESYTISFERAGYEPQVVPGVNVAINQTHTLNVALVPALREIGRVFAIGTSGAFQPHATVDRYNLTASQILMALGKAHSSDEAALLRQVPGVSVDSTGYPVIRGGRQNEQGYQVEGINYVDPFTTQFVNSLVLNGESALQVTPGPGDSSQGNVGAGIINVGIKRGTYPPFGSLDLEATTNIFGHQLALEYGVATPNGRFSDYVSFLGSREDEGFGAPGADSGAIGEYYAVQAESENNLINNFIYKFGKVSNQQFQLFYQNQIRRFVLNRGGIENLQFKTDDPLALSDFSQLTRLSAAQVQSIVGLDPEQTSVNESLNRHSARYQPNESFKLEYSNNIDASTYVTVRYAKVNAVTIADYPFIGPGAVGFSDSVSRLGGLRSAVGADLTKQLGSRHLIKAGGTYEFQHPIADILSNDAGFYALGGFGRGYELADFLSPSDPSCPLGQGRCGYLSAYFPNGVPRVPLLDEISPVDQQLFGLYFNDTYSPSERVRVLSGGRIDGVNTRYGDPTIDKGKSQPRILSPVIAAAYRIGANDAVRASFSRSMDSAPLTDVASVVNREYYDRFAGIPAYDAHTGAPAMFCGLSANQPCKDYADQLYWANQSYAGPPIQPVKPETFSNFDFSYSHRFRDDVELRLTPFYRRGYDVLAKVASIRTDASGLPLIDTATGVPLFSPAVATNNGVSKTTGIEFLLTKGPAYGFSGWLAATYVNELSNVVPLSVGEDFLPSIPLESLALGNLYRVGYLSPFQATATIQYRTRSGIRVNPIVRYDRGYPINRGLITAFYVNGVPYNVPNTNVTSPLGPAQAPQYVNPQNPGTLLNPNIAATRGTPETASPGGILSSAELYADLSLEYSPPRSHSTIGLYISNLFDKLNSVPIYNERYQPVTTGVSGPLTGSKTGFLPYGPDQRGYSPYLIFLNQPPLTFRLYCQLGF
jgi:hypothetical protein